ncbi:MAG: tRNA lysidine(34) synthetase TilS [Bacteroidota bacterium]|nr:tRNA lysidine(34) synthetase TilS [Bacteroidota bacterium]
MKFLREIIENQDLFSKKDKLLVGVSGGLDSMVLSTILHETGFFIAVAHVNYGLRGEESDQDESFIREWASQYQIATHFLKHDLLNTPRINIQKEAREIRYAFFQELQEQHHYDWILTGHHADDVIENLFLALSRGSGLNGLKKIAYQRNSIIRPFVNVYKKDLLAYAVKYNIAFQEDSSNNYSHYRRNFFRNEILPKIESMLPEFSSMALRSMDQLTEAHKLLEFYFENWKLKNIVTYPDHIEINITETLEDLFVKYYLSRKSFHYLQIQEILEKSHQTGRLFYSKDNWKLLVDRGKYILVENEPENKNQTILFTQDSASLNHYDFILEINKWETSQAVLEISKDLYDIRVDAARVSTPLVLRYWKAGDKMKPLGMNGHTRKIQNILTDLKIPRNRKEKQWVLCAGNDIIWLPGICISESIKITDTTVEILQLKFSSISSTRILNNKTSFD